MFKSYRGPLKTDPRLINERGTIIIGVVGRARYSGPGPMICGLFDFSVGLGDPSFDDNDLDTLAIIEVCLKVKYQINYFNQKPFEHLLTHRCVFLCNNVVYAPYTFSY